MLLLPSPDDNSSTENLEVLISRILTAHMQYFERTFDGVVEKHIQHKYSSEMQQKSTVVRTQCTGTCMGVNMLSC